MQGVCIVACMRGTALIASTSFEEKGVRRKKNAKRNPKAKGTAMLNSGRGFKAWKGPLPVCLCVGKKKVWSKGRGGIAGPREEMEDGRVG